MSIWCVLLCTWYQVWVQRSYTSTRTARVSCSPVPRAAYLVPGTRYIRAQKQATASEVRGSVPRGKNPCQQLLPQYRCLQVLQAEQRVPHATGKKRSFPWNVDPLRSTTLRGIRNARTSRGKSSALNGKSYHASVSVMLEKRGGWCRTDGPRRVRFCQMLHTIAAINAAWCRSLRWAT